MKPVTIGILGCGKISPAYVSNLTTLFSSAVRVKACADLKRELAEELAGKFGVPVVCGVEELLADEEIELVVNLTPASAHYRVSRQILEAGKHCFSEKPLALTMEEGRALIALAKEKGVQMGGAADTFLSGSPQRVRQLIDEGAIGVPICATAFVSVSGFHNENYHRVFRGALLDMGPYYIAALVAQLGPIKRVAGMADIRFPEKPYAPDSEQAGQTFANDLPTTVAAALEFADGCVGTLVASCDVHGYFPRVEIYGTKGSVVLGDGNGHAGKVTFRRTGHPDEVIEQFDGFTGKGRGVGVAEMAVAIRENRECRASGALMLHVLEVMLSIVSSSDAGAHHRMETRVERPAAFDLASTVPMQMGQSG